MTMLITGLLLFFAFHFATAIPAAHAALAARVGENGWKAAVTLGSLAGVTLIVIGWKGAPTMQLFAANTTVVRAAPLLVSLALVLIVIGGGNLRGYVRRTLHHPMLVGTLIWSGTHLLANGGLRETLLFGCFFVFALFALVSLLRAGKRVSFEPALKWDLVGLVLGLVLAGGIMHAHHWLFGVAVV